MEQGSNRQPDLVIAHGTGTLFNDSTEDMALEKFLHQKNIPVTGTKWCIGHSLGASGAVDLIAGCEILKNKKPFHIHNVTAADPELKMNYLTSNKGHVFKKINTILLTTLGFGGVHGALTLSTAKK